MKKLILLSVIIVSIVAPIRASRAKDGKAGLKKALVQAAIFELIYVGLVTQLWLALP